MYTALDIRDSKIYNKSKLPASTLIFWVKKEFISQWKNVHNNKDISQTVCTIIMCTGPKPQNLEARKRYKILTSKKFLL